MTQAVSLHEQISRKLSAILAYYIGGTAALIFLLALLGIGYFHKKQLEQYEALVATKLSAELTAVLRESDSVGNSTVVWTGLTDSVGREIYLKPLLERINKNSSHQMDLLDYRGRDYIVTPKAAQTPRLSAQAIQKTIETSTVQAELYGEPGQRILLFALPISAPFADGVLGLMLTSINLDEELKNLNLPADLEVDLALGSPTKLEDKGLLTQWFSVPVRFEKFKIPLQVNIARPIWSWMSLALVLVAVLLVAGYWLFTTLSQWATQFSKTMTQRIRRLVDVTAKVASQPDVEIEPDLQGDEISEMFAAIQSIVLRQRQTHQKLLVSSRVFETAAEAILITDSDGCVADVNEALLKITGYQRSELMGKPAGLLYKFNEVDSDGQNIGAAVRSCGEWRGETYFLTREQDRIPVMMAVSSLADSRHRNLGNVAIISDIRQIKQVEHQLRQLIYQDQLTGLPNYRAFSELVDQKIRDIERGKGDGFVLLFIDLDYLKHVNDSYGHEQGDQVIIQFAKYLQDKLPQPHFLCRRSGDEFIAVIETSPGDASAKERLTSAMGSLGHTVSLGPDLTHRMSFSAGAAAYPEHAKTVQELLVLADSALLFSKEAGRSRMTWLNADIVARIQRRHQLEMRLPEAVRQREIYPIYQAEVDLRDGQVTGFEALARWRDDELGDVSPAEFIAVAEDMGLIDQITEVLLEKLVIDTPLIRERFADAKVAFNVSPRLLSDRRIAQRLKAYRESGELDCANLVMEVTESDLMQDVSGVLDQLNEIKALGTELAIDDFGQQYSSLSRLANMPIHKLKIDSSFVFALRDESNVKVVDSIMALAKTMNLQVTAEGVEQEYQRQKLLEMGCTRAQGFLFAKPVPLDLVLVLPQKLIPQDTAAQWR